MTHSPHADHARERAQQMQAQFDAAYSPDSPRALRNIKFLTTLVVGALCALWWLALAYFALRFGVWGALGFVVAWLAGSMILLIWGIRRAPLVSAKSVCKSRLAKPNRTHRPI